MTTPTTLRRLYDTALDAGFSWEALDAALGELGAVRPAELRAAALVAGYGDLRGSRAAMLQAIRLRIGNRRQFHQRFDVQPLEAL